MSSEEKITPKRLGIIAGAGHLPLSLVETCQSKGMTPYVVCLEGQASASDFDHVTHSQTFGLGKAGAIMAYFKSHDVADLVMIGAVKRPSLTSLKPDLKAVKILSKIGMKALGDDGLLRALKGELEREGFTLHGMHEFCDDLLMPEGVLGSIAPDHDMQSDIEYGLAMSQHIGRLDIGQSVIIQQGVVIGVEAIEGTDALIQRCAPLFKEGRKAILVKTCKPQQDRALDMPTIGIKTLKNLHKSGLCGVVLHAHNTLLVDREAVADYADTHDIFVYGATLTPQ